MSFFERRQLVFQWIGASVFIGTTLLSLFIAGCCLVIGAYSRCGRLATRAAEEKEMFVQWNQRDREKVYYGVRDSTVYK